MTSYFDEKKDREQAAYELLETGSTEQIFEWMDRDFHSVKHMKAFSILVRRLAEEQKYSRQVLDQRDKAMNQALRQALMDRDNYKQERDEARREACKQRALHAPCYQDNTKDLLETAKLIAKQRGWKCFEESDK